MKSKATTPKHDSKLPTERTLSMRSKDQLQPPYPQSLDLVQTRGDGSKPQKPPAPLQPHAGSTGRSSSSRASAGKHTAYLPVGRAWGKTAQKDRGSSATGCSPMSQWERGSVLGRPWDGVGEVAGGASGGERSGRLSRSENHTSSERDSDCAKKGSSR